MSSAPSRALHALITCSADFYHLLRLSSQQPQRVHEVEQAREQRHAAGLVRGGYRHSDVRLHRVNSEKHLKIEEAQHKVEGGAGGGREESDGG